MKGRGEGTGKNCFMLNKQWVEFGSSVGGVEASGKEQARQRGGSGRYRESKREGAGGRKQSKRHEGQQHLQADGTRS